MCTLVLGVRSEVLYINGHLCPRNQHLELPLTEQSQPLQGNHGTHTATKRLELVLYCHIESVVSHQVDVLNVVCASDRDLGPSGLQLDHSALAIVAIDNSEVEREILYIALIVLKVE